MIIIYNHNVRSPDEIVRGFHEVAVAALAFEEKLDDAPLLGEGALDRCELLRGLVRACGQPGAHEAVDQLFRIAPMSAGRAQRDENTLLVPAAQLLDRDAQALRSFLDAVFDR